MKVVSKKVRIARHLYIKISEADANNFLKKLKENISDKIYFLYEIIHNDVTFMEVIFHICCDMVYENDIKLLDSFTSFLRCNHKEEQVYDEKVMDDMIKKFKSLHERFKMTEEDDHYYFNRKKGINYHSYKDQVEILKERIKELEDKLNETTKQNN